MIRSIPSFGLLALALAWAVPLLAASVSSPARPKLKVAVVRNDSDGPKYMVEGGLLPLLEKLGCEFLIDRVVFWINRECFYSYGKRSEDIPHTFDVFFTNFYLNLFSHSLFLA